ncbi:beta-lactamase/transpeptidase-like protein [Mollisia scopiformis]|uniref:Beta-lactamase/transpeptidase-like protein n=1 Tax=Mollisia scopiformis TaxID=149040 RepID=A0A194WXG5_MOLSC|nr:beta-lactamase/transpeptidase-like protein [Mollisia scopiformis]KUJ12379.1 beta-lactamase/transpeptidase-like protein [Mollisia scopiformis]
MPYHTALDWHTWLGVEGHTIIAREDLLDVVSQLPPVSDLRGGFHYNNYAYAVVGKVIDQQTGFPWYEFLRARVFEPLGMKRTTTNRKKLPDENLAEPHVVLDDRSIIKPVDVSDDTVMGAAGGVRSSVTDMMKWAKALLDGIHNDTNYSEEKLSSPLKQVSTIVAHRNLITTSSVNENTYALGFARAMTPSTELWMISLNSPLRENVMGRASPSRLVLYHNGGQSGYLSAFYLSPETRSAIVALGNSYGLGDGPDWTCQAIMQAMFDLEPKVDFAEASRRRAQFEFERYERLASDYARHREEASHRKYPRLDDFVGRFENKSLKMSLDIRLPDAENKGPKEEYLILIFNDRNSQHHRLQHYSNDTLGFLPISREELIVREMIDWFDWDQFVLTFRRDESGKVKSVDWALQVGLPPVNFQLLE